MSDYSFKDMGSGNKQEGRVLAVPGQAPKGCVQLLGKAEEVQSATCTLSRYHDFRQCKDCARDDKTAECHFKGWRVFPCVSEASAQCPNTDSREMLDQVGDIRKAQEAAQEQALADRRVLLDLLGDVRKLIAGLADGRPPAGSCHERYQLLCYKP